MSDIYEADSDKLGRKIREQPMVPIGMAGFVIVCIYGAYKYRHRGDMSRSLFLVQLRVAAQGTAIGCFALGLAYTIFKKQILPRFSSKEN